MPTNSGAQASTSSSSSNSVTPDDDRRFMAQALREAQLAANEGEVPVGAVVVSQNKIIARAHNLTERLNDVTAHAEMQAITSAANAVGGKYLKDSTLYVTVEPCPMCAGAIGWAQITRLVYGAHDDKRGFTLLAPNAIHPRTEVVSGVMEDECKQLMQQFFKDKRQVK